MARGLGTDVISSFKKFVHKLSRQTYFPLFEVPKVKDI